MAGNDHTDSPRPVNPNPVLVPGGMYTCGQITGLLGISPNTLKSWEKAGLRVYRAGQREGVVFSDDVMSIIRKLG